jgi:transposase-like protein
MNGTIDIKEMINARKARGMILLENGFEPKEIKRYTWVVPSQTGNGIYTVHYAYEPHIQWTCTCKDFELRQLPCKHIAAVQIWKNLKERFEQINLKVQQQITVKPSELHECKFCHSPNVIHYGTKNGKQNFMCKACGRKFVDNVDFEGMKYNPKIIALTLDLYFRGLSLRKVCQHLKEFYNLKVSYVTVYRWIEKYIGVMNGYVNTLQPEIGGTWHTDEMMVGIGGSWEYLWNVMDEKTRFQLASVVSKERKVHDARVVFQKAKKNCGGRKPKYIITDGLGAYRDAINKEFNTNHGNVEHLWNVGLEHHPNNNHVERLHGTIRQRTKVMRGLKVEETPIVQGNRLFYNFIKPHEALGGKTPSEEAGITIEGEKWLTLIRTAIENQRGMEKKICNNPNVTTKMQQL